MSWGIPLQSEGGDIDKAEFKRKIYAGDKWAKGKFIMAISNLLSISIKKSPTALRKEMDDNAVYMGVAAKLLELIEQALPTALKDTEKKAGRKIKEIDAMKTLAIATIVREIVEGADELKKL